MESDQAFNNRLRKPQEKGCVTSSTPMLYDIKYAYNYFYTCKPEPRTYWLVAYPFTHLRQAFRGVEHSVRLACPADYGALASSDGDTKQRSWTLDRGYWHLFRGL